MHNIRQPLIQGLLAYTATAGVLTILCKRCSWLPDGQILPYAFSYSFPFLTTLFIFLTMAVASLVCSEWVLYYYKNSLQDSLWMALFCLTFMGIARHYLDGLVGFNAFLVFSVYLIRFQQRLSSLGFLYQCLLALVFLWPSAVWWIDAANDEWGIPTGIGSGSYDDFTDWISFFFVPFFFIVPGLFPAVKKRFMYLGCGLSIFLAIVVATNRDLVFFLITGHYAYFKSVVLSPSIEPIAWILPCFYIVYSLLAIGLGKLGYWLFAMIAGQLPRYST